MWWFKRCKEFVDTDEQKIKFLEAALAVMRVQKDAYYDKVASLERALLKERADHRETDETWDKRAIENDQRIKHLTEEVNRLKTLVQSILISLVRYSILDPGTQQGAPDGDHMQVRDGDRTEEAK